MSSPLCSYSGIFGNPGEGIHKYRFMGIAIMDFIFTIIFALLFARLMNWNYLYTIIAFFVLGIILHRLFCVRTTIDKILFPTADL